MFQKVEEHRSVRDNHGNEEEIVTKQIGEQGYSVTKKRDSMGREEVQETFTNMDERKSHDRHPFPSSCDNIWNQPFFNL